MDNINDLNNFLNERKVTVKRRYTEAYPARNVSTAARVRNAILDAVADGHITEEEMSKILSELKAHKRWLSRNKDLFKFNVSFVISFFKIFFASIIMGIFFNYLIFIFQNQLIYDSHFKSFYLILSVLLTLSFYLLLSFFIKAFNYKDLQLRY
mgnify:CR=1 FL=1